MNSNVEIKNSSLEESGMNPFLKFFRSIFKSNAGLTKKRARSGYIFVLPFILGVFLVYVPLLVDSLWISLYDLGTGKYLGFSLYGEAFATPAFTEALLAGLQQLVFEVPAVIVFSLFIAVVLNHKMLGRAVFRAIFFVPVIISTGVMEAIISGDVGADPSLNTESAEMGSENDIISVLDVQNLFNKMEVGAGLVKYVVNIVNDVYNIINYSGVQMLIFLAGLQSISPSIYEACKIDGATGWETFWKITFPMISPMILVNTVYTVIDSFTRTTNPTMMWIENNITMNLSKQAAMYWIYFIIVALILAIVAGIVSSFVFYQRRD